MPQQATPRVPCLERVPTFARHGHVLTVRYLYRHAYSLAMHVISMSFLIVPIFSVLGVRNQALPKKPASGNHLIFGKPCRQGKGRVQARSRRWSNFNNGGD